MGRKKGSKNRPKVSPLVEEKLKFVKAMEAAADFSPEELKACEVKEIIFPVPVYDPFKNPRFREKMGLKDK